jgi:V/A-type H+-transporting ATPase subunit E
VDIAEKIMAIKNEIIDEVKEENNKKIEKSRKELKKKYDQFQKELENKQQDILKSYKSKAEQKREQIISRAILEKKNIRRKKLNECMNNFINELQEKLEEITAKREYYLFIFNSLKEAALKLPGNEFKVFLREKDQNLKSDLENLLQIEMENYEFEIELTDKMKSGGFIIQTKNGQQLLENTFSALIESYKEEIAIEIKNNIL